VSNEGVEQVRAVVRESEDRLESRLVETMRDMKTEMLGGLERFSRGNFARRHRLESGEADLNDRLNALEERVLALETRPR
jgi:hypothetical protein